MHSKNRIILVGNGFDLAHNFKTGFCHFADYFIDNIVVPEIIQFANYENDKLDILSETFKNEYLKKVNAIHNLNDNFGKIYLIIIQNKIEERNIKLSNFLKSDYNFLKSVLKNKLFSKLYQKTGHNWFDIENSYFNSLKSLKNRIGNSGFPFKKVELIELNQNFQEIKKYFIKYLNTIEIQFNQDIEKSFFPLIRLNLYNIYVINFNYTSSVHQYIGESENVKINHIHGNLKDGHIIFGYGNDEDQDYLDIKNTGIDEFLEFFKTFDYMTNENYMNIYSDALEKFEDYDVEIIGHSLGLTDKTLLSEIFNSPKCKKIYLNKRKDFADSPEKEFIDYRKLLYASSRIITNEKELRKKVINYKNASYFPS